MHIIFLSTKYPDNLDSNGSSPLINFRSKNPLIFTPLSLIVFAQIIGRANKKGK